MLVGYFVINQENIVISRKNTKCLAVMGHQQTYFQMVQKTSSLILNKTKRNPLLHLDGW